MANRLFKLSALSVLLFGSYSVLAAIPLDLRQQDVSVLNQFEKNLVETKRSVDFNQTLHVRMQQTYQSYPIWGADIVLHIPQGGQSPKIIKELISMAKQHQGFANGKLYNQLEKDLANAPAYVFEKEQAKRAEQTAVNSFLKANGKHDIANISSQLIVYVDENNQAHWAFKIAFEADPSKAGELPAQPIYIMDALSFAIYQQWDNIQTVGDDHLTDVSAGGFGGNEKMGKLTYDGIAPNLSALNVRRDSETNLCYLQNKDVFVNVCTHMTNGKCAMSAEFTVSCDVTDPAHNNVYWNGDLDAVNGGYSPSNDALYAGNIIKNMYQEWFGIPVLVKDGEPMMLKMVVHLAIDNAYWNGSSMNFGDGVTKFYPLTSLGVAAHEISHGFTTQHSDLTYSGQSGGMNESFSDMAAQAAEYYAYGKNSWEIGPEIVKEENKALRYMEWPSKDCGEDKNPGESCSINFAQQYTSGLNVHYSSGVYNRFFYLLSTTRGWNVHKAFNVMVQANSHYWTKSSNFTNGACGVLQAAKDYRYSQRDVTQAFAKVGIVADRFSC